jgi:NAD(P)-dependent dehydrogenase (short-subunit alcohol dehydrogenase family)
MGSLDGKVALVTGATAGIGAAAARALAAAGAVVVLAGRRIEEGERVAHGILDLGGRARFIQADVTDEAQVAHLVAETVSAYGRLDIAFNNAGANLAFGPLERTSADAFMATVAANLLSTFYSLKYEIPAMQAEGGSIINTASTAGVQGVGQGIAAYVAAKHGVVGLTRAAALEQAQHRIRVNAILPGPVASEKWRAGVERTPGMLERIERAVPLGRVGSVEDIAALVVFLAGDGASFITGAALPIDGGQTAGSPRRED